jgi:hypothetical protein
MDVSVYLAVTSSIVCSDVTSLVDLTVKMILWPVCAQWAPVSQRVNSVSTGMLVSPEPIAVCKVVCSAV